MKKAMIRWAAVASMTVTMLAGAVTTAAAATPVKRACFGESVSIIARAGGSAFGGIVSGYAHADAGVGGDVQAVQAGYVDDVDFPNTCN